MRIDFGNGWYYDYEEMTVEEQLRAKTFWQLYLRGLEIFPATPTAEQIFLQEMNELNAVASLIRKDTEYTFEEAKAYIKSLKGGDVAKKIEEAKSDFFGQPVIGAIVSMNEFKKFIETLKLLPESIQTEIFHGLVENLPDTLARLDKIFSEKA